MVLRLDSHAWAGSGGKCRSSERQRAWALSASASADKTGWVGDGEKGSGFRVFGGRGKGYKVGFSACGFWVDIVR